MNRAIDSVTSVGLVSLTSVHLIILLPLARCQQWDYCLQIEAVTIGAWVRERGGTLGDS